MSKTNPIQITGMLKNWSVVGPDGHTHMAPEITPRYLHGNVYDHSGYANGTGIGTSAIVKVDGSIVITESGSVYELETPSKEFVEWCKEMGCHVPTPNQPIKG